MKNLLKSKRFLLVLFLIVVLILWIVFRTATRKPLTPSSVPPLNSWEGIVPGASLFEDVNKQFGEPINQEGNLYEYSSDNPNLNHKVVVEDGVVVSMRRITVIDDQILLKNLLAQYGEGFSVLYSETSVLGDDLYVYFTKGVAILGNPNTDRVLEIWYFKPVSSMQDFVSKYAPDYSTDFPGSEEVYF